MTHTRYLWAIALAVCLGSCSRDVAENLVPAGGDTCDTLVTYGGTIEPILSANCSGCHFGAAASAGIRFDSYTETKKVVDKGLLLGVVSHAAGFTPMPLGGGKLSDCKVSQIQQWIEAGAPND